MWFIEVPHARTPAVERAVATAVAFGRQRLGIAAPVSVTYFLPAEDYDVIGRWPLRTWLHREGEPGLLHGVVHPDEPTRIYLRATLDVAAAGKTVLHELCHVRQFERAPDTDQADAWEAAAEAFAQAHWPQLKRSIRR